MLFAAAVVVGLSARVSEGQTIWHPSTKSTWQATYDAIETNAYPLTGLPNLLCVRYRSSTNLGEVIDLANDCTGGSPIVLWSGSGNAKGQTPVLSSLEAYPSGTGAVVTIVWRHPGAGAEMTRVGMFYSQSTIIVTSISDIVFDNELTVTNVGTYSFGQSVTNAASCP